ncbi:putative imidazolonepropionase [Folsomia candida]|uniref:Probable imidazolonepropionase n=1 Tax=Folsomia candida TaxID=158441 RepID=A0A226F262_FOLCA|nr:putative imidazolonepropionase [Folsomia candida]
MSSPMTTTTPPTNMLLLVHSAKQIVRVVSNEAKVVKGTDMKSISVLVGKPGDGLSLVVGKDGLIAAIGFDSDIKTKYRHVSFERTVNASDLCILPGFVDAHTHPVWAGDRLAGASYMDIHNAGGGIHYTVDHTRRASEEELFSLLRERLIRMSKSGTTVVECKSGYGLNTETELKMLRVLERAKREISFVDISITYCGAHAIPKDMTEELATKAIISEQLPAISRAIRLGEISVDNIDVFCEKGVFEVDSSRQILEAGRALGFKMNFHADEIYPLGGTEMGASIGAEAISHLEQVSDTAIQEMARNESIGVILPTTAYILRLPSPPVRKLIEANVPIALGSDFNPNAFCLAMPMVMHLACILCHMSLEEALVASTINAAATLGLSGSHGSLEVGKKGDIVMVDVPTWEHLIYQFGEHENLIQMVIKAGFVVYDKAHQ